MAQPHYKKIKLESPTKAVKDLIADIDFEDDIFDHLLMDASESVIKNPPPLHWRRCTILSITNQGNTILGLQDQNTTEVISCCLQGVWMGLRFTIGDTISLKSEWSTTLGSYVVNNDVGYVVTLPDHLVSGTTVMGSLFCSRKAVFQEMFKGMDSDSEIMVIGTIIHGLLESVVNKNLTSFKDIQKHCDDYIKSKDINFMLYSSGLTKEHLAAEVKKFVPKIFGFMQRFLSEDHKLPTYDGSYAGKIREIADIEENVWLPQMGLKGKIDMTVSVESNGVKKSMPLELKTGKASFSYSHKGQVTIYQMMMEEQGRDAEAGLLLYLRDGILKEIKGSRHEKRDLIMLRNNIAHYLSRKHRKEYGKYKFLELPEPINHHNACLNCPYNTICSTFLSRDESLALSDSHPLKQCGAVDHLTTADIDYFFHWSNITILEDMETMTERAISRIWTDTMESRVNQGRAINRMKMIEIDNIREDAFSHTFQFPKTTHDVMKNDYIILSTTKRLALTTGFVEDVQSERITINLAKNLKDHKDEEFVLDKHESQSMFSYHLTNLGILLEGQERSERLRKIIVEKCDPEFDENSLEITSEMQIILDALNPDQRNGVLRSLSAKNYLLLQGLPGTGKTQTLVALIQILVMAGKSVLISAHTHSAIDNVLIRLMKTGMNFLRLGSTSRVMPELRQYCDPLLLEACSSPDEISAKYQSYAVVAVTCLGAAHPLLSQRVFDVCIVDESTQVIQTAILKPLFSAKKFILVGDPDQLPPVIKSRSAVECGASESLFSRLLSNKKGVATLAQQYRMNRTITNLANQFMYEMKLKCANSDVEHRVIQTISEVQFPPEDKLWLERVLSNHLDMSTILLNTGNVYDWNKKMILANEVSLKVTANPCEMVLISKIVTLFKESNYNCKEIGIIAPYRVQVEYIRSVMEKQFGSHHNVEINTVDQYQGRDKDIIIYSGTKSQPRKPGDVNGHIFDGDILNDKRRLNVAITRARCKFIMICDQESLTEYGTFRQLFELFKGPQKINLQVPIYKFDFQKHLNAYATVL